LVISNPNTGDVFLDLMIVSGVTEKTLKIMSRDIEKYVRSLSKEEYREYVRIWRAAKEAYCR